MAGTTFQFDDETEVFMKKIALYFFENEDEWLVPNDVVRRSIENSSKKFNYKKPADVLTILNINRYSLADKKRFYINFSEAEEAELTKFQNHYKEAGYNLYKNQILKMMIFNYYSLLLNLKK